MSSRELIRNIIHRQGENKRPGFWLGNPNESAIDNICAYYGVSGLSEVQAQLKDEILWTPADRVFATREGAWTVFDGWDNACVDCETIDDLEAIQWPNPQDSDFTPVIEELANGGDRYRASGMWAPFFHDISALIGMEEYFIAMYERPDFIHALTTKLVDFYCEANRRFFKAAQGVVDAYFFGNDLGSQINTLVSPSMFEQFIKPYIGQLVNSAKEFGLDVIMHSCGAISSLVPSFIELGIDAIHPLQIKAAQMDSETLKAFKGQITFIGGIDTQELLRLGSKEEIEAEIEHLYRDLGPDIIISPSHESVLPDIPPVNLKTISDYVYAIEK